MLVSDRKRCGGQSFPYKGEVGRWKKGCVWFWSMNRVWDSSIYQTKLIWRLYFYFSDQIFPLWPVGSQWFLGSYLSKGQFLQCFKPVTKLFWKLEYRIFRFASILLLWFQGYHSLFLRFFFVKNLSLNYPFPLGRSSNDCLL